MTRIKNALVGYFVAAVPPVGTDPDYLELAEFITEVNDNTDETTEDFAYYSGDGTATTEVTNVKGGYDFVGYYLNTDAAQKFIADKKFEIGEGRKILFRQVLANGDMYEGDATVSAIVATGGAAQDYEPFQCTIQWNKRPTFTPLPVPGP